MTLKNFLIIVFLLITPVYFYSFSAGVTGTTRKNGTGCICHESSASADVRVNIIGPDTMNVNDSADFVITLTGGPLVRGGTNIAVRKGKLIKGDGLRFLNNELTHTSPFLPENNTVTFRFKYMAPSVPGTDTIYANGNSVNFNEFSTGDKWNFAPDKKIIINSSTGINSPDIYKDNYSLEQNFPNPFNPQTTIKFSIKKTSFVNLSVFDISGKVRGNIINSLMKSGSYEATWNGNGFASGIYFYTLTANNFSKTYRMILLK